MPTFSRTPFDPAKPQTYDGTNQSTVPLTADQRTQHANGNTAFSAAHDDVAALESGKADQTALDAHTGAANPHSGSAAKASPATAGNVAQLDAGGDLVDSAIPAVQVARLDAPNFFTFSQVVDIPTGDGGAWLQATGKVFSRMSDKGAGANQEMFESSSQGGAFRIWSRNDDGSAAVAVAEMTIHHENLSGFPQGVLMGNPAGGAQGRYSLNVEGGLYVNGVELTPGGGSGTLKDVTDDTTTVADAETLRFVATNDASVQVQDDGGGVARITIDASAAAGGGIGKGTTFAVGGLLEVESDVGSGTARTHATGLLAADVRAHLDSTDNPHGVMAAQIGALTQVAEDTTPVLGGDLETKGNNIVLTRADNSMQGVLTETVSQPGAVFSYWDGVAPSEPSELHAVSVEPNQIGLWGTSVFVDGLQHAELGGRQVYVSEDGILYGVDPPPVGWTASAADTGDYNLGTGDGQTQAWVEISGLGAPGLTFAQDVEVGQRIDVSVNLYIIHGKDGDVNDPFDKSGSVDIGFGIGGATPGPNDAAASASIGPYFSGWVPLSFSTTADQAYSAGTELQVFGRNGGGDDGSSTIFAQYSTPGPNTGSGHEAVISTPGSSSGGGGGGNMVAPGVMDAGNLYQSTGDPKITADSGIAATVLLRNDAGGTIGASVGHALANRNLGGATPGEQNPTGGQLITLTDNNPTIAAPTLEDGVVTYIAPAGKAGVTIGAGFTRVEGAYNAANACMFQAWRAGTVVIGIWSSTA